MRPESRILKDNLTRVLLWPMGNFALPIVAYDVNVVTAQNIMIFKDSKKIVLKLVAQFLKGC